MNKKDSLTINDISKIRKIVSLIIGLLEKNINEIVNDKDIHTNKNNKELLDFLIGSKENIVSTINKLSNLLVKIIPLEKDMQDTKNNTFKENLDKNDLDIIKRYIQKCGITLLPKNNEPS